MHRVKKIALMLMASSIAAQLNAAVIEKPLNPQSAQIFNKIKTLWKSNAKSLRDFDRDTINTKMNSVIDTLGTIVEKTTTPIPLTEIANVINLIRNQQTVFKTSGTVSPQATQALKDIFNATKDFYKKLIETQKIIRDAHMEAELIGNTTSFDALARGVLVVIKDTLMQHNANPALTPLIRSGTEKENDKKAFKELQALKK